MTRGGGRYARLVSGTGTLTVTGTRTSPSGICCDSAGADDSNRAVSHSAAVDRIVLGRGGGSGC